MRRIALILIAIATVAPAKPVGWTAKQRACPVEQAPGSLSAEVIKTMLPGATEQEFSDAAAEQLAQLALGCARQTKVAKARLDAYVELATWQLASAGLATEVKARGVDPAVLSATMNVGPGRANPSFEKLSDDDVTRMMVTLKAKGIDVEGMNEDAWQVVGAYLEATSRANRAS